MAAKSLKTCMELVLIGFCGGLGAGLGLPAAGGLEVLIGIGCSSSARGCFRRIAPERHPFVFYYVTRGYQECGENLLISEG